MMLSDIPIVQIPATEFSIDGCEEAIIWTTASKREVLHAIRTDTSLFIYYDDDFGPKWLRGEMNYESTVIDIADKEHVDNVASVRGSTDFISGVPTNVRAILIVLSHLRRA
jgi:hypothetical protein